MFASRNPVYNKFKSLKCGIFTIEGIIGVGKTTMGRSLERFLNDNGIRCKFFSEYINIDLLSQYIGDMPKYAYSFQMIMLCKRIEIYRDAERFAATGGVALIDRSIIGDMTFARMQKDNGNFTSKEWDIYLSLMKNEIQMTPTASLYLRCSTGTSLTRVKKRGIQAEIDGYTSEYMDQLYNAYETSINECSNVRHVILDWNNPVVIEDGYLTQELICEVLEKLL
jgi:deoxyadenosine/deoxycytidine kinase